MKIKDQNNGARTAPGRIARAPGGPSPTRSHRVRVLTAPVAATVALSMGLLALAGPGPAGVASPAQSGEIAFTSARSGHNEVYLTDVAGAEPAVKVTNGMVAYSPDLPTAGGKVAFTGRQDGKEKVYVANTGGSEGPVHVEGPGPYCPGPSGTRVSGSAYRMASSKDIPSPRSLASSKAASPRAERAPAAV